MDESTDVTAQTAESSFQLEDLEFIEAREVSEVPTPDALPRHIQRKQIPLELQRSATVEALIAQNEDLMARLKVNLRRLTQSENELDELRRENRKLQEIHSASSMEAHVFAEKETGWMAQIKRLEDDLRQARNRNAVLHPLEDKVERYRKYHERIKTQVKPFVHQLKGYAESLSQEVQKLYAELAEKEHSLDQSRRAKARLEEQMQEMLRRKEDQQALIVEQFERDSELLKSDLKQAQARTSQLELIQQNLDKMRVREDELENMVVALKRDKDLHFKAQQEKEQALLSDLGIARGLAKTYEHQFEELKKQSEGHEQEKTRLQHQNVQLQEQIASLRFMWANQSSEMEKMQAAMAALERLNTELSRQLNSFRQSGEAVRP